MMSESDKRSAGSAHRRKQNAELFSSLDSKSLLKEGMGLAVVNDLSSGFEAIAGKIFSLFRAGRIPATIQD